MRKAATALTYIGGILTALNLWIDCLIVSIIATSVYDAWFVWFSLVFPIAYSVFLIVYLSLRFVTKNNKVAWGITTILFVSAVGGILTLCTPNSQLECYPHSRIYKDSLPQKVRVVRVVSSNGANVAKPSQSRNVQTSTNSSLTEDEKIERIAKYKKLYDDGVLTEEEYKEKRKKYIDEL